MTVRGLGWAPRLALGWGDGQGQVGFAEGRTGERGAGCEARLVEAASYPKSTEIQGWNPATSELVWILQPWKWPSVAAGWGLGLLLYVGVQ